MVGLLIFWKVELVERTELPAGERFDLGAQSLRAPIFREKFQAGTSARVAVALVAIDGADGVNDRPDLLRLDEDGKMDAEMRRR